jgi:hypothetical protein
MSRVQTSCQEPLDSLTWECLGNPATLSTMKPELLSRSCCLTPQWAQTAGGAAGLADWAIRTGMEDLKEDQSYCKETPPAQGPQSVENHGMGGLHYAPCQHLHREALSANSVLQFSHSTLVVSCG